MLSLFNEVLRQRGLTGKTDAYARVLVLFVGIVIGTVVWIWSMLNFIWEGELEYYLAAFITVLWLALLVVGVWGLWRAFKEL